MAGYLRFSRLLNTGLKFNTTVNCLTKLRIINNLNENVCSRYNKAFYSQDLKVPFGKNLTTKASTVEKSATEELNRLTDSKYVNSSQTNFDRRRRNTDFVENLDAGKRDIVASNLSEKLKEIDFYVRRYGRIEAEQIEHLLKLTKKGLTGVEAVMLLKCCSKNFLVKETSDERKRLYERIWKKIKENCENMTIQVMNAKILAEIDNKIKFQPSDMLTEIENIMAFTPNRMTYQLLLDQYCELDDIEGASKILEHMKSTDPHIDISIMHSFIRGHLSKGNLEAVQEIISTMKKQGMESRTETYALLMDNYAKSGDLVSIKKVVSEMRHNDVPVSIECLNRVAVTLAEHHHEEKVKELLETGSANDNQYNRNQDIYNSAYRMLAIGSRKGAVLLLDGLTGSEGVTTPNRAGQNLIRLTIEKGRPISELTNLMEELDRGEYLPSDWNQLALWAIKTQKSDYILEIFDIMQKKGYLLKHHYFWPVFKEAANRKDKNSIYAVIDFLVNKVYASNKERALKLNTYDNSLLSNYVNDEGIKSLGIADAYELEASLAGTLYRWAAKELVFRMGTEIGEVVWKFKELEVPLKVTQAVEVSLLVSSGKFKEVTNLLTKGYHFSPAIFKAEIAQAFKKVAEHSAEQPTIINDFIELMMATNTKVSKNGLAEFNSGVLYSLVRPDGRKGSLSMGTMDEDPNDIIIDESHSELGRRDEEMVNTKLDKSILGQLVQAWSESGLVLATNFELPIMRSMKNLNIISPATVPNLKNLFGSREIITAQSFRERVKNLEKLSVVELENLFAEEEQVKGRGTSNLEEGDLRAVGKEGEGGVVKIKQSSYALAKTLLNKYCSIGDVARADKLAHDISFSGFNFSPDTLNHLAILSARNKNDVEGAGKYISQIQAMYPSFNGYFKPILYIAKRLFEEGKFEEGLQTLNDYSQKNGEYLQKAGLSEGYLNFRLLSSIVSCAAAGVDRTFLTSMEKSGYDAAMDKTENVILPTEEDKLASVADLITLSEALFVGGYIMPGAYSVLESAVLGLLKRNTSDAALEFFEHSVENYKKAPAYKILFAKLVQEEDGEKLQKAVDMTSKVYHQNGVMWDLIFCFIEGGKLKQARKLIEGENLKVSIRSIRNGCSKFIKLNKEKELKEFVELVKGHRNLDRDEMLFQLIRYHANQKDVNAMMEAFSQFQSECLMASSRTLRYVANVLQTNNMQVPFEIPPLEKNSEADDSFLQINGKSISPPATQRQDGVETTPRPKKEIGTKMAVVRSIKKLNKLNADGEVSEDNAALFKSDEGMMVKSEEKNNDGTKKTGKGKKAKLNIKIPADDDLVGVGREKVSAIPEKLDSKKHYAEKPDSVSSLSDKKNSVISSTPALTLEEVLKVVKEAATMDDESGGGRSSKRSEVVPMVTDFAKLLLVKRDNKSFRTLVYHLSESGSMDSILGVSKLKIPRSLNGFIDKKLFLARLKCGKGGEMVEYLEKNPRKLSSHISSDVLQHLSNQHADVFQRVENLILTNLKSNCQKSSTIETGSTNMADSSTESWELQIPAHMLYSYYLANSNKDKLEILMQLDPSLKAKARIGHICYQARMNKNESLLRDIIETHRNEERPRRILPAYNDLLLLKCEEGNGVGALACYDDALKHGLTFDDFSVRSLYAMETVLKAKEIAAPWQAGALDKKAKEVAEKQVGARRGYDGSSSSSSESD